MYNIIDIYIVINLLEDVIRVQPIYTGSLQKMHQQQLIKIKKKKNEISKLHELIVASIVESAHQRAYKLNITMTL